MYGLSQISLDKHRKAALQIIYINRYLTDAFHKLLNKCEFKLGLSVDPDFREARPCRQAAVDTCPKRLLNGLQDPDSLLQGPCTQRHRKDHRTPCRLITKFLQQLFNTSILFLLQQKLVSIGQTTIMTGRVRTCFKGAGFPRLEENSGTWSVLPFAPLVPDF